MHFSLGQSSDRKAILRNLLEMHHCFLAGRPADAAEYLTSDRKAILRNISDLVTNQSVASGFFCLVQGFVRI